MIESEKSNSIPDAILVEERINPLTSEISPSDVIVVEAKVFKQMNEIKKVKKESCCYKNCCKYDDTIGLDYYFWFYYWYCCFINENTDINCLGDCCSFECFCCCCDGNC
jgi:hypothetical protein